MTSNVEQWRPIPGFEGFYEVSDLGRVRGVTRELRPGRIWQGRLLQQIEDAAYLCVSVHRNGTQRKINVHTLVLEAFVGPRPEGMEACHGDGNAKNNALSNLRWDTPKANHADMDRHGTRIRGRTHPLATITEDQAREIRARYARGATQLAIAQQLGTTERIVGCVVRRETWTHI